MAGRAASAHRRLGTLTVALAVVMAFTRVYVVAHFPLDVVTGLLVGAAVAWASYAIVGRLVRHLVVILAHTPIRPLLTSATKPSSLLSPVCPTSGGMGKCSEYEGEAAAGGWRAGGTTTGRPR